MNHARSRLAFPVALLLTGVMALLPGSWREPWLSGITEVVRFPLRPFSHAGIRLASWLRPPPGPADDVPAEYRERIEQLVEDRDVAERLYQAERRRVLELEAQNRELQRIPPDLRRHASTVVTAYVTRRSPSAAHGLAEARLERGAPYAVPPNTVAVYGGAHLVARTVEASSRGICQLLPVVNAGIEPMRARVFPRGKLDVDLSNMPVIYVEPTGGGAFRAEVDRTVELEAGDVVRLDDDGWRATAQMMILGTVASVRVSDSEPLRHTVVIEPAYRLREVASVTLMIEGGLAVASEEETP